MGAHGEREPGSRSALPAVIERLRARGVEFRTALETGPGGKQIQVKDPDGNSIELFEPARRE